MRKSVKAGPFRFNMSPSGVGVSVGVPGFRVGTSTRGNYVRVGAAGLSYRSTNGTRSSLPAGGSYASRLNSVVMTDVTGATVLEMQPTGHGEVVRQLNAAARHFAWAWVVTISALILGAIVMPWGLVIWAAAMPICWWMFLRDAAKRRVVLFYDVNDDAAAWYESVLGAWEWFTGAQNLWRITASGDVQSLYQHKTNAGASALVRRVAASAALTGPTHLATNVAVPSLNVGKSSLYFLPTGSLSARARTTWTSPTDTSACMPIAGNSSNPQARPEGLGQGWRDLAVRQQERWSGSSIRK